MSLVTSLVLVGLQGLGVVTDCDTPELACEVARQVARSSDTSASSSERDGERHPPPPPSPGKKARVGGIQNGI